MLGHEKLTYYNQGYTVCGFSDMSCLFFAKFGAVVSRNALERFNTSFGVALSSEESLQNHVRLLKNLLGNPNYDKRVLPVTNFQHAINITMDMQLFQIIEINEPAQYLQLYVSMVQTWHDELLSWDPSDFGGLDTIILPHDSIWIPDTYLYNMPLNQRKYNEKI
uniref:Neurotransmitter-gated ion-channel ligand-binding domain-containing protein n=1 Tax=Romanomermis culicivorax TaxID=13658 RepID=A0A915IUB0_ROMCU